MIFVAILIVKGHKFNSSGHLSNAPINVLLQSVGWRGVCGGGGG